jgi:hypothetical protein
MRQLYKLKSADFFVYNYNEVLTSFPFIAALIGVSVPSLYIKTISIHFNDMITDI